MVVRRTRSRSPSLLRCQPDSFYTCAVVLMAPTSAPTSSPASASQTAKFDASRRYRGSRDPARESAAREHALDQRPASRGATGHRHGRRCPKAWRRARRAPNITPVTARCGSISSHHQDGRQQLPQLSRRPPRGAQHFAPAAQRPESRGDARLRAFCRDRGTCRSRPG